MPSIFRKECPQCATPNDVTAVRCRCGYCFDPDALSAADAADYEDEQRRLYRDYLEARLVQAHASAIAARDEANADSTNALKKSQALLAEQEVGNIRAELNQYPVPSPRPTRTPVKANATAQAPAAKQPTKPILSTGVRAAVAKITSAAKAAAPKTQSELVIARTPLANNSPPDAFRELQAAKAALAVTAPTQSRFKRADAAKPAAAQTSGSHSAPSAKPWAAAATQECPVCTATVPATASRCGCGFVFDRSAAEMPAIALKPVAAPAKPVADTKQECPNCTATLPVSAKRCGCGYVFAQATSEMPGVSLDPGSLALLNNNLRRR